MRPLVSLVSLLLAVSLAAAELPISRPSRQRSSTAPASRPAALCTARFSEATTVTRHCTSVAGVREPAIAAGGGRTFRAWLVGGVVMTDSGLASTRYVSAFNSSAAVDATGLLAAWTEARSGTFGIVVGGLTNDGARRPEVRFGGDDSQDRAQLASPVVRRAAGW